MELLHVVEEFFEVLQQFVEVLDFLFEDLEKLFVVDGQTRLHQRRSNSSHQKLELK